MKDFLAYQANLIGILVWIVLAGCLLYGLKKVKTAKIVFISAAIIFYVFSTAWLPRYLAYRLETKYAPLTDLAAIQQRQKVYIHLLGSGYQTDSRLPPTAKLGPVAQVRFNEAMRLYRHLQNSILVCSANAPAGGVSQAMIVKAAALDMGADSSRLLVLDRPSTTREEAEELAKAVGVSATVIVVTDAIHMPRAMAYFKAAGFSPIAAPTNFRAINGSQGVAFKWIPAEDNIYITNRVLHEYFASVKGRL